METIGATWLAIRIRCFSLNCDLIWEEIGNIFNSTLGKHNLWGRKHQCLYVLQSNPTSLPSPPHGIHAAGQSEGKGKQTCFYLPLGRLPSCQWVFSNICGLFCWCKSKKRQSFWGKRDSIFLCTNTTGIYHNSVLEMPLADLLLHPPLRFPTHTYIGPSHAFSSVSTVVCSRTNEALLAQGPNSY